jgi:hypothetical protein
MTSYQSIKIKPLFKDIKERESAYKRLFADELGGAVLRDLLRECAVHRSAFSKSNDQTNYNLGKQHVGYHIMGLLQLQITEVLDD